MKDVKKLLKSQSKEILPDENLKFKIADDLGISRSQPEPSYRSGGAAVKIRRNTAIVIASVAAVAVAASSIAVWLISRQDGNEFIPSREFQFGSISSATDFYAYGAVSMGGLLSNNGASVLSDNQVVTASQEIILSGDNSGEQGRLSDDQKANVEKYFVFATGMLGGGVIASSVVGSDRAEYSYKLSADYVDDYGMAEEYSLYFNAKDGVKKDKYALEGVLIIGGNSYFVEGKYESESDDGETENEISFKAYTSHDKRSYISLKYESENSETETESGYTVSVYKNNHCVEKACVSHEIEEGQTSYEIKIKKEMGDVNLRFEGNGKGSMGVIADFGGEEHRFGMTPVPKQEGGGFNYDFGWGGWDLNGSDKGDKDDADNPPFGNPGNGNKEDFGNPPDIREW